MNKKILVTGGAGFIGSAVIRYAFHKTNFDILNIDKLTYAGNLESLSEVTGSKRYQHSEIDICNFEKLCKAFDEYKPNYVMHLAAESHVDRSIEGPADFINTNIIGTFNMLEAARYYYMKLDNSNKEVFRFHHISTDEVYGDLDGKDHLFTELTPYSPSSPYSASKASSDHLVRSWNRTYKLPTIVTNCSNNYGPFHFPEKLVPHIIINAIKGNPLPVYGDGMQIRDWLYVEDHAEALIKVLINGKIGETYNIGGNNEKTNLEVIENICSLLEKLAPKKPRNIKNYRDLITFVKDRPGHDIRYAIDASKLKTDLGWVPNETFESGIEKTVNWYLANDKWWNRVLTGEYKMERLGN